MVDSFFPFFDSWGWVALQVIRLFSAFRTFVFLSLSLRLRFVASTGLFSEALRFGGTSSTTSSINALSRLVELREIQLNYVSLISLRAVVK